MISFQNFLERGLQKLKFLEIFMKLNFEGANWNKLLPKIKSRTFLANSLFILSLNSQKKNSPSTSNFFSNNGI